MLPVLFNPEIAFRPGRWGRLNRDLDRLFDRCIAPAADAFPTTCRVDAWEDEDHVYLAADVPGLAKDDLEIDVDHGVLTIAGQRKTESQREHDGYHVQERRFGKFERRFRLPESVDGSDVQATLKDGVLTLTLKKSEQAKPRKVEVRDGPKQ